VILNQRLPAAPAAYQQAEGRQKRWNLEIKVDIQARMGCDFPITRDHPGSPNTVHLSIEGCQGLINSSPERGGITEPTA
jgi:hypothetical protein